MKSQFYGRVSFAAVLEIQSQIVESVRLSGEPFFMGFESEPVITIGRRGSVEKDVVAASEVPVLTVNRGGEATYHMPGQLIVFPIAHLPALRLSVRQFVHALLESTREWLLTTYGVETRRGCETEPGLYTEHGKIAFFGLRIDRGVASHGMALNVCNDLAPFADIRSCGVSRAAVDSLANHGVAVSVKNAFESWIATWVLDRTGFELYS